MKPTFLIGAVVVGLVVVLGGRRWQQTVEARDAHARLAEQSEAVRAQIRQLETQQRAGTPAAATMAPSSAAAAPGSDRDNRRAGAASARASGEPAPRRFSPKAIIANDPPKDGGLPHEFSRPT